MLLLSVYFNVTLCISKRCIYLYITVYPSFWTLGIKSWTFSIVAWIRLFGNFYCITIHKTQQTPPLNKMTPSSWWWWALPSVQYNLSIIINVQTIQLSIPPHYQLPYQPNNTLRSFHTLPWVICHTFLKFKINLLYM